MRVGADGTAPGPAGRRARPRWQPAPVPTVARDGPVARAPRPGKARTVESRVAGYPGTYGRGKGAGPLTGASGGIVHALARQFAEHGCDLVINAEDGRLDDAARGLRETGAGSVPYRPTSGTRKVSTGWSPRRPAWTSTCSTSGPGRAEPSRTLVSTTTSP